MKRTGLLCGCALFAALALLAPQTTLSQTRPITCSASSINKIKALALPALRQATVDFGGGGGTPPGTFDPLPLLNTDITVSGTSNSCLVAHFSSLPEPADNHIVYQVRVDGVPMQGHYPNLFGFGTPAVSDPNQSDVDVFDPPRMASYTFFTAIAPGTHRIEVLFAGCCSGSTGQAAGNVGAATLTLQYR